MKIIFLILSLSFFCQAMADDHKNDQLTYMPDWEVKDNHNSDIIGLIGNLDKISAEQWNYWKKNAENSDSNIKAKRERITTLTINYCYVTKEAIDYLTIYSNVTNINLGNSIEGVTIDSSAFKLLQKFKKLECLNLSIHGLNAEHLAGIKDMKTIKKLIIQFPDFNMITNDKKQLEKWKPTILSDPEFSEISKIESLESIYLNSPFGNKENGYVGLSSAAIKKIILLPNLKELHIDKKNLDRIARMEIDKLKLSKVVKIE